MKNDIRQNLEIGDSVLCEFPHSTMATVRHFAKCIGFTADGKARLKISDKVMRIQWHPYPSNIVTTRRDAPKASIKKKLVVA
jgi:hypothetical protein